MLPEKVIIKLNRFDVAMLSRYMNTMSEYLELSKGIEDWKFYVVFCNKYSREFAARLLSKPGDKFKISLPAHDAITLSEILNPTHNGSGYSDAVFRRIVAHIDQTLA